MPGKSAHGEAFAFRLFLGVALTILATGLGTYTLIGERVRAEVAATAAAAEHAQLAQAVPPAKRGKRRAKRTLALVPSSAVPTPSGAAAVEPALRAVRKTMLLLAVPAILASLGIFWLLSGRYLHRRHQSALDRAVRDGLTDLGNHRAFQDELRRAASLAERTGMDFALAVFDVDDFKFMNDRRGHQHGDDVLRRVAGVLAAGRGQDRAFRTGGDEFALIMPGTSETDGRTGARRIRHLMSDAGIQVSCGLSATRAGMRAGPVLREEADAALYEAKRNRVDDPVCYSEIHADAIIVTPEKAHSLRLMLHDRAVDVALQPIWDLDSGTLVGVEGLARPHGDYGFNGPADAFDVAEQTGRIEDLDRLCVARILERASQVPAPARLFVNVHPASLEGGADWLFEALRTANVEADRVVVEVTERTGARLPAVIRAVERLRQRGLRVALDDVGAGNSGLQMMHSLVVDYVKVDRAVVAAAATQTSARAVLAAIIAFADATGTYVIAEGIEDAEGLEFLRALEAHSTAGIRGGQGYGLGRPAPTVAEAVAGATVAVGPASEVVEVAEPEVVEQLARLDVQVGQLA